MTLKQYEIDKIIELWLQGNNGVEAIAEKTGHSKNTVRKYLRLNGYLPYQYPPDLHAGPPSPIDPSTWSTNKPNPRQQGGWFYKEIEKKNKLLENATERIQELEQQENTLNQNLDKKNDEHEKLKKDLKEITKERDKYREQNIDYETQKQMHDEQQEDLLKKWQNGWPKVQSVFSEMKNEIKTWKTKYTSSQEEIKTLRKEIEDNKEKETSRKTLEPSKDTQITTESETPADKETGDSSITIDWPIVIIGGVALVGLSALIYLAGNTSTRTPQQVIPILQRYDTKRTDGVATVGFRPSARYISPPSLKDYAEGSNHEKLTPTNYFNDRENQNLPPHETPCSGIFSYGGENTDVQGRDNSGTPVTNFSGIQCSDSNNSQDNACIESTFIPNKTDAVMPSDTNNDVTFVTRVSGDQSLGIYCSSHFDIGFTPQDTPPIQVPSLFQIPLNYIRYIPFPTFYTDISEIYPMKQMRNLGGISFEIYIEKLIKNRGCPVERTKQSHDKGIDNYATLNGKKTVIQCKQQPKVGIDAVQRIFAAKYRPPFADHALVITTGSFTKDAIDEAEILGVELWDGKRLLEEIYKDQFFALPE
jgi:Restriction endonuclease